MAEERGKGGRVEIDAAEMLEVLEDVTHAHTRLIRSLRSALVRVKRDTVNEEMQRSVLAGLRRLRVMRNRLARFFGGIDAEPGEVVLRGSDALIENVATLSEFMLIVALPAEEEVLKRALLLAKRGAELLAKHSDAIREDLEQVKKLSRLLERIVEKYYK